MEDKIIKIEDLITAISGDRFRNQIKSVRIRKTFDSLVVELKEKLEEIKKIYG